MHQLQQILKNLGKSNGSNGLLSRLFMVLVAIILPLVMIEVAMRGYHTYVKIHSQYQHAANSRLVFIRKPHAYREINVLGFRDQEYKFRKPTDVFRIIVLGDSVTNGYRVDFDEMYTNRLAVFLNKHRQRYEVMNFGINQYSTVQEIELLKDVGLRMNPDLVILSYVLNDPTPDGSVNDFFRRDKAVSLVYEWVTRRSKAALHVQKPFHPIDGCHYFDYYSKMHCDATKWTAVQDAFQEFRALSQQYGFRILLVVFPLLENHKHATFDGYRWISIHKRIVEEATRNGFSSLDLLPHFSKRTPLDLKVSPTDTLHPNGLGNEIAAAAIYQKLADLGIVTSYSGHKGVELMEK